MKLKLNKTHLKNLSLDEKALPMDMTPDIGGGAGTVTSSFCGKDSRENCYLTSRGSCACDSDNAGCNTYTCY